MVRIAIVQLKPSKLSNDGKIEEALNYFKETAKLRAKIVCLPEHWLSNSMEMSDKLTEVLGNAASTYKFYLISGANFESIEGKIFINSLVFNPKGKIIANRQSSQKAQAIGGFRRDLRQAGLRRGAHLLCHPTRDEGEHHPSGRVLQGLRDDRVAYRLCRGYQGGYCRHDQDSPIHHNVRPDNGTGGGDRGIEVGRTQCKRNGGGL